MIKINELRIGNWINEQGLELQVGIINSELFKGSEPIPLTEEWLLKFGFICTRDKKKDGRFNISVYEKDTYLIQDNGLFEYSETPIASDILYVHQLQNLMFALTGEELEIINP